MAGVARDAAGSSLKNSSGNIIMVDALREHQAKEAHHTWYHRRTMIPPAAALKLHPAMRRALQPDDQVEPNRLLTQHASGATPTRPAQRSTDHEYKCT